MLRGPHRNTYDLKCVEDSILIGSLVHSVQLEIIKGTSRQGIAKETKKTKGLVDHQGVQIDFDYQTRRGGISTLVFEIIEVEEEGLLINSTARCPAMLVDVEMQGLHYK